MIRNLSKNLDATCHGVFVFIIKATFQITFNKTFKNNLRVNKRNGSERQLTS